MNCRDRRGFALPLVIFVLTLITLMLATIFVRVQVDRRIAESSGDVLTAQVAASSGLNRYFAHYDSLGTRPPDGDSLRINVIGGYADVVAHVARRPADSSAGVMYVVRSRGRVIKPTQGADPQAVYTVAQYARWQFGSMDVMAALTAINDFAQPCGTPGCDGTFYLSGYDDCGSAPSVAGLRIPSGSTPNPIGPPEVVPFKVELDNAATVALQTNIDWAMVTGGGFEVDYTSLTDLSSWSSYLFAGSPTFTDVSGTGLLVVTGNLTLGGSYFDWQGVVLIGGKLDLQADSSFIRGAAISGLNQLTGPVPSAGGWGLDSTHIDIRYNSCYVRNAFRAYNGFAPIGNARISTWKTY